MNPLDEVIAVLGRKGVLFAPRLRPRDLAAIEARVAEAVALVERTGWTAEGKAATVRELERARDKVRRFAGEGGARLDTIPGAVAKSFRTLRAKVESARRDLEAAAEAAAPSEAAAPPPDAETAERIVRVVAALRRTLTRADFASAERKALLPVLGEIDAAVAAGDGAALLRMGERYLEKLERRKSRLYDQDYRGQQALLSLSADFRAMLPRPDDAPARAAGPSAGAAGGPPD